MSFDSHRNNDQALPLENRIVAIPSGRMFAYERKARYAGFSFLIGIDEAGRGPLAGPVVAAAVHLRQFNFKNKIDDSKVLTPHQREAAFHEIMEKAVVGVGVMNEFIIDHYNILHATFFAMANAVRGLIGHLPPDIPAQDQFHSKVCLLVDGNRFSTDLPFASVKIVRGDSLCMSIACASIVAKVLRDRMLLTYDKVFPQYGFAKHKGYPTKLHKQAIQKHGLSLIHRKTFAHELSP